VTPLIETYNKGNEHLYSAFGVRPFAGIGTTTVCVAQPAIAVAGVAPLHFADRGQALFRFADRRGLGIVVSVVSRLLSALYRGTASSPQ
jgi:hypothetical protein